MSNYLLKYIFPFILMLSVSIHAQLNISQIDAGKIFQLAIYDDAYLFDYADYSVFIPDGVTIIKGVFIHQHGCSMEGIGSSTAYDIQYQAMAKKWGLAIVGPDIYPKPGRNCIDWIDAESGSAASLIKAMELVGKASGHAELTDAPWLLWGHSGGGYWTLSMMKNYPDRIIGVFAYSPAFNPQWEYPQEAFRIPLMIRHAGATDGNNTGIDCWQTALNTFAQFRKHNGYVSLAYTHEQNHNYSYVRYMAIPFFEAILTQRLPDHHSEKLKAMNQVNTWYGDTATYHVMPASAFQKNVSAMNWLPDSTAAMKWREYVITGTVADKTPPPAPYSLQVNLLNDTLAVVKWKSDADIESGIKYFNIRIKDGLTMRFPESDDYQKFNTNGDNAEPVILPELQFEIIKPAMTKTSQIFISAVNHFNLESPFSDIAVLWP